MSRPSVGTSLILVGAVAPFMLGLVGLYALFSIDMPCFGFLFLLYWAGILQQARKEFLPSFLGGLTGISLGFLLVSLPGYASPAGSLCAVILLGSVLFCFLRGHLRLLLNNATMLFLIAATIGPLGVTKSVFEMMSSLTVGALYMGAVSIAAQWWGARGQEKGIASPPSPETTACSRRT